MNTTHYLLNPSTSSSTYFQNLPNPKPFSLFSLPNPQTLATPQNLNPTAAMAKRLLPNLNRVLIEKIVPSNKTSTGILLPEKTSKLNSGMVVAVGPGARDRDGNVIPVGFKEGDTVLLPEYGGTEVKLGDKEYCLFRDEDILGTLRD